MMIRAKQTKDILKIAKSFHRDIGERYEQLSDKTDKERLKMLFDYLGRHERELINSLNIYESEMSHKVLNTFFRFLPDPETINVCRNIDTSKPYTVEETIALALEIDQCLINLYESIINHSDVPEVKNVFKRILKEVKHNKYVLSREALELGDV